MMTKNIGTQIRRSRFTFAVAAFGLVIASAACSLIVNTDTTQCSTDGDCAGFAAGAVCRDSVCVKAGGPGSGLDGDVEGSTNGEGGPGGEAGPLGPCQTGGFRGTPTTNAEFLNQCTGAQCLPFDNCAKLGLCGGDAGFLPAVDPEGGAASSPPPATAGITTCESLLPVGGLPIYVTGSSNFPGFLKLVAPLLATDNHYVIWQQTNSCTGVSTIFQAQSGVVDLNKQRIVEQGPAAPLNPKSQPTFLYDATGAQVPCTLADSASGTSSHFVDVGESDVFADSCTDTIGFHPNTTAADIGAYTGPIQAMTYLVPGTSTQTAISAEAANAVYGHGGVPDGTKLPWVDPAQFYNRTSSTGTNQLLSRAMNVNPTKWWGVDKKSASGMVAALKAVPADQTEKTIGVVSTDLADQERGNLKVLAFQATGQICGFWPDTTPFATDKKNVRDGHYPIWGPLHFYTHLTGGAPSEAAGAFVLRFSVPRLDQGLVEAISKSGNVPQCAMHVTRDIEMGDLKSYISPYDCDCIYEKAATGAAPAECQACVTSTSCPSNRPACNYGFCEKE
jgi:hypothetical protein